MREEPSGHPGPHTPARPDDPERATLARDRIPPALEPRVHKALDTAPDIETRLAHPIRCGRKRARCDLIRLAHPGVPPVPARGPFPRGHGRPIRLPALGLSIYVIVAASGHLPRHASEGDPLFVLGRN